MRETRNFSRETSDQRVADWTHESGFRLEMDRQKRFDQRLIKYAFRDEREESSSTADGFLASLIW